MFTEPVLSRKNGGLEIAWYSDHPGAPMPLKALDRDARTIVEERLRERLATLAPLLREATVAPALARALYIQSADNIFALGQEPVLVNWAVLPPGMAQDDQSALERHFAATLGPYASFGPPRLVATRASAPVGPPAAIVPPPPLQRAPRLEPVGLLIATGIAAALTLLLNLPGILAYPAAAPIAENSDAALEAQRAITKAMQEKIAAAAAALKGATCDPDGTLKINLPDGGKAELAPKQIPARPKPGDSQGDMAHVADVATQSVVLVVSFLKEEPKAPSPDSSKGPPDGKPEPDNGAPIKTGSGFFIGPGTIVTNAHVIDGAESVFITNHFLGKAQKATVKYRTGALSLFEPDFAVLEAAPENSPPAVTLSPTAARLMNVVSAGFPGVVDEWDPQYKKLLHGDENAAPEVTTFPGFVTLIQDADGALPRIVHSATIGHGNSGGPLLDLCGRALGINTLKNTRDDDVGYVVSNALATRGLMAFLDANHVAYQQSNDACQPAAPAPTAKLPGDDAGKPAPRPGDGIAPPPPDKK